MLTFESQVPNSAASPLDTATEIDRANPRHMVTSIAIDITVPLFSRPEGDYCAVSSSCRRGSRSCPMIASSEKSAPTGIAE